MNKVSIIIPVYNVENYLHDAIESIIKQTYTNIEIILIDDNSKDNSLKICKEYEKKDSRIKVIKNKKNEGVSYTRNKGIDVATGKYIVFMDSDDTVEQNYIFELMNVNKEKIYDLVVINFKNIFIKNDIVIKKNIIDINLLNGKFFDDYYYIRSVLAGPWGKLFKRDIIEKNNIRFPLNINSAEDYAFNMQYYKFVKQYKFINLYSYNYFHRQNNSLSQQYTINNFKNHLKVIKKEYDFFHQCHVKNSEIMLGDCLVTRCLGYMVLKKSFSYNECKKRLNLLKQVTNNPKKCTKIKDKIILNLINKKLYILIYSFCLLRIHIRDILKYFIK